jgi:hypothetical protein
MKRGNRNPRAPRLGWWRTAWYGAEAGAALAFVYGLLFIGYAIVRSTLNLLAVPNADEGSISILLSTWVALALSSLVTAALASLPAGVVGALTALALRVVLSRVNRAHAPWRAIAIGAGICLAVSLVPLVLAVRLLGMSWTPSVATTLIFWLILPIALYAAAGGLAGWQVNRMLAA